MPLIRNTFTVVEGLVQVAGLPRQVGEFDGRSELKGKSGLVNQNEG